MDPAGEDDCKTPNLLAGRADGNAARSWQWRQMGQNVPRSLPNKSMLELMAEGKLVYKKNLNLKYCEMPGYPRSTFLMVFSPDGRTVASTHGNHHVYLTELSTGKHVGVLKGHPRTPWCVEFHPSHSRLVASGCLGGQVRVWDLSGGSEVWTVGNETEIASIAFHPRDQLLVIATFNELYFWDWSQPAPFTKVCTNSINEKVRYVAFDSLGHKLITGISVWNSGNTATSVQQPTQDGGSTNNYGPGPSGDSVESSGENNEDIIVNSYDLVQRYDSLVRNYHRLYLARTQAANMTDRGTDPMEDNYTAFQRYRDSRLASMNGIEDFHEEPLEPPLDHHPRNFEDDSPEFRRRQRYEESLRQAEELPNDSLDASRDGYLARLFGSRPSAFQPLNENSTQRRDAYRSRYPAFLYRVLPNNPFSSSDPRSPPPTERPAARDQGTSRSYMNDLANSTSSSFVPVGSSSRTRDIHSQGAAEEDRSSDNSRSSPFTFGQLFPLEEESSRTNVSEFSLRRRALHRLLDSEQISAADAGTIRDNLDHNYSREPREGATDAARSPPTENTTDTANQSAEEANSISNFQHRSPGLRLNDLNLFDNVPLSETANGSSDARAPSSEPIDLTTSLRQSSDSSSGSSESQSEQSENTSINQNLDIIRDILRDSGTRLLNLITDMSYSSLASSAFGNGQNPRSNRDSNTPADEARARLRESYAARLEESRARHIRENYNARIEASRARNRNVFGNTSSSETDSDHSLEVNIYRSRNATFSENTNTDTTNNNGQETPRPTNRMVVNLDLVEQSEPSSAEPSSFTHTLNNNTINITVSNNRFRLRTNNSEETTNQSNENQPQRDTSSTSTNSDFNADITLSFPVDSSITGTLSFPAFGSSSSNSTTLTFQNSSAPSTSAAGANLSPPSETPANPTNEQTSRHIPDPQVPSTSRDSDTAARTMSFREQQAAQDPIISEEALRKVKLCIEALQRHTSTLTDMWLRGTRTSMKNLRIMWEDLRRQIVILHRQTGRTESSAYFARSLLERCHMLTDISRSALMRSMDSLIRNEPENRNNDDSQPSTSAAALSRSRGEANTNRDRPSTSRAHAGPRSPRNDHSPRANRTGPSLARSQFKARAALLNRRRYQANLRSSLAEDSPRGQRLMQRLRHYRQSRDFLRQPRLRERARTIELHFTRHEIRVRAMQVLSMMFNVMMSCLEEGELSTHITVMLRTLKRALGVTCLLLMTSNRGRESSLANILQRRNASGTGSQQRRDPEVGETTRPPQNEPDPQTPSTSAEAMETSTQPADNSTETNPRERMNMVCSNCSELQSNHSDDIDVEEDSEQPTVAPTDFSQPAANPDSSPREDNTDNNSRSTYRWSNRLAVQISNANRNLSDNANRRREIYLERKRMKALHRYNPIAHPLTKRKYQPLISHRIPSPRNVPQRHRNTDESYIRVIPSNISNEPVAGPSNANSNSHPNVPRRILVNPELNAGYMRLAQRQAARLHRMNRTRNRFRIRLYTPSSVREMFDILTTSPNEREPEPAALNNNSQEASNRRSFASYRPQILTVRNNLDSLNPELENNHPLRSFLSRMSVPMVQVNNVPVNEQPPSPNRYVRPLLLAQEAVGGRLLEAGLISDTLAVHLHRVQAWDFTTGELPQIKDNTKNIVVPRCKIHNDSSVDISRDGKLLVALLPSMNRTRNVWIGIGVYSLEWNRLGTCLHNIGLGQSAVSVSFSPTGRHLALGLGVRRLTTLPMLRNNAYAMLIDVPPERTDTGDGKKPQPGMIPVRVLCHNWENGFTSLNCLRWAPTPGQGLLYANNTGQLIILS